jgi:hypothetical protein
MADRERFVAVALLTSSELQGVGTALRCVMPLEDAPEDFADLLAKVDQADEGSCHGLAPKEIGGEQSPRGEERRH